MWQFTVDSNSEPQVVYNNFASWEEASLTMIQVIQEYVDIFQQSTKQNKITQIFRGPYFYE